MLFCPRCTDNLHITDRQGIEIDFCPICRGVWLDSGELEKIIERAIQTELRHAQEPAPALSGSPAPQQQPVKGKKQKKMKNKYGKQYYKKYKKKHVLEQIFDLFD